MKAQGVRCIPESEIGLSVLYCSLNRYCNPRFNPETLVGSSSFLQPTQPINVACNNTEEVHSEGSSDSTAGPSKNLATQKRTKEATLSDEDHASKKSKHDSEDIFSSQNIHFQNTESNPKLSLRSGKSQTFKKNTSLKSTSMTKENKPFLHDPSLDMFAPSGERSSKTALNISVLNPNEVRPSCDDMFGSGSSKISNSKTVEKNDGFASTPNRQGKRSKVIYEDNNDEFSFPSKKKTNKPSFPDDENDEFSFVVNKRSRVLEQPTDEDDVFSFQSNKRSRRSNPDMFATGETSNNSTSTDGSSKLSHKRNVGEKDEVDFKGSKRIPADDEFAFPEDILPKRKRNKGSLNYTDDPNSEVKIALFSKPITDTHTKNKYQIEVQPTSKMDIPEVEKNLITYSKHSPMPSNIKKEIKDEEVDDLAMELHNATIVLVKPLIVFKPKPVDSTDTSTTVKNFKTFRKVIGVKKPVIPKIIGGCDLVAHCKEKVEFPDNLRPLSPQRQTPDDDWTFLGDKKKGRGR